MDNLNFDVLIFSVTKVHTKEDFPTKEDVLKVVFDLNSVIISIIPLKDLEEKEVFIIDEEERIPIFGVLIQSNKNSTIC